jgi:hypothetical protein
LNTLLLLVVVEVEVQLDQTLYNLLGVVGVAGC